MKSETDRLLPRSVDGGSGLCSVPVASRGEHPGNSLTVGATSHPPSTARTGPSTRSDRGNHNPKITDGAAANPWRSPSTSASALSLSPDSTATFTASSDSLSLTLSKSLAPPPSDWLPSVAKPVAKRPISSGSCPATLAEPEQFRAFPDSSRPEHGFKSRWGRYNICWSCENFGDRLSLAVVP